MDGTVVHAIRSQDVTDRNLEPAACDRPAGHPKAREPPERPAPGCKQQGEGTEGSHPSAGTANYSTYAYPTQLQAIVQVLGSTARQATLQGLGVAGTN